MHVFVSHTLLIIKECTKNKRKKKKCCRHFLQIVCCQVKTHVRLGDFTFCVTLHQASPYRRCGIANDTSHWVRTMSIQIASRTRRRQGESPSQLLDFGLTEWAVNESEEHQTENDASREKVVWFSCMDTAEVETREGELKWTEDFSLPI
jgi:hypothetical protein